MQLRVNGKLYNVEIIKKKTTKNTYIRVKEDFVIYVTCNYYMSDKKIIKLLEESLPSIAKMIEKMEKKSKNKDYFWYLGEKYDIVYTNNKEVILGKEKAFIPRELDMDKWYKKQAEKLFLERLDENYQKYSRKIPYPSLTIRKMTTRWGVCNTKTKRVTLNLELMKKDIRCLDYVIIHELTHLVYADHSKKFWNLVEENFEDYKKIRKLMKED